MTTPRTTHDLTTLRNGPSQRILVAGGAGLIGASLCERLLSVGHTVICADDFSSGHEDNLRALSSNPRFEVIRHDVTLPIDVAADAIYNLACPASPVRHRRDPVSVTRTCVLGALNLLELARRRGAPILLASTSEVYGDPEQHPQPETYWGRVNPIGPRACYDEGKRCAESLFFDYRRQYGLIIKVARIFNTYGPRLRVDDGRVVSTFITQALSGRPLTVHGDGSQTRSFCYVDDLVDGLVRMMATSPDLTGPVNLGNPEEISMTELARRVIAVTGSRSEVAFEVASPDDPRRRKPDITLAAAALGWRPNTPLDVGLASTIASFRRLAPPSLDAA